MPWCVTVSSFILLCVIRKLHQQWVLIVFIVICLLNSFIHCLLQPCLEIVRRLFVVLFVAQSFLNYALLCIIFTTSHAFRMARNADCCTVKKQHLLLYIFVSVVDVEANYFVVKAYQYTTVTSVQVLEIF